MVGKISEEHYLEMLGVLDQRLRYKIQQAYSCGALVGDEDEWVVFNLSVALLGADHEPHERNLRVKFNNLSHFI